VPVYIYLPGFCSLRRGRLAPNKYGFTYWPESRTRSSVRAQAMRHQPPSAANTSLQVEPASKGRGSSNRRRCVTPRLLVKITISRSLIPVVAELCFHGACSHLAVRYRICASAPAVCYDSCTGIPVQTRCQGRAYCKVFIQWYCHLSRDANPSSVSNPARARCSRRGLVTRMGHSTADVGKQTPHLFLLLLYPRDLPLRVLKIFAPPWCTGLCSTMNSQPWHHGCPFPCESKEVIK
jgi:hypothetical protein